MITHNRYSLPTDITPWETIVLFRDPKFLQTVISLKHKKMNGIKKDRAIEMAVSKLIS